MSDEAVAWAVRIVEASVGAIFAVKPDKSPATAHGFHDATDDLEAVRRIAASGRYGVHLADDIVAVDVDDLERFAAEVTDRPLPGGTWVVETPNDGHRQAWFRQPSPPLPIGSWAVAGFDLRTHAGYCLGPGSTAYRKDQDGKLTTELGAYRTVSGGPESIAPMPDWLAEALRRIVGAAGSANGRERAQGASGTPASARYGELLAALRARTPKGRRKPGGWSAHCPGPRHRNGDQHPSLAWDDVIGLDGQRTILLRCWSAGCRAEEIVTALGFSLADLFDRPAGVELVFDDDADDGSAGDDAEAPLDPLFVTARDRAASLVGGQAWLLRPWLPTGALILLTGKVKEAGKSTFAYAMARAIATGADFMGEPIAEPRPVVILTEMYGAALRLAIVRAALDDIDTVWTVTFAESRVATWPQLIERTATFCRRVDAGLVFVDGFGTFAGLRGEAENDAGAVQDALRPLQILANDGNTVLTALQARKARGSATDVVRGSSAGAGAADLVLALRRDARYGEDARVVETLGRFDETPPFAIIALTDEGYIRLHEDDAERRKQQGDILAALPILPETMTRRELKARLHRFDLDVLVELVAQGHVQRLGRGVLGDGYRFGRPA